VEVEMPQETDASALIGLLWLAWICWSIHNWLTHPAAGKEQDPLGREKPPGSLSRHAVDAPSSTTGSKAGPAVTGPLAAFVAELKQADPYFDLDAFRAGAAAAYEAVVLAFAAGDRERLQPLLSAEVYAAFAAEIAAREARGEQVEVLFSRVAPPNIRGGYFHGESAVFAVGFTAELFRTSRGPGDDDIAGAPAAVTYVHDEWLFTQPKGSRDPAWRIMATSAPTSAGIEIEECCA
jgi:predicted lipid-binding transport protein (Tim44 family)